MKPNLLYIFADQWRYEAMGCHHADQVTTPNMDRFAGEGMDFSRAYSTYPLCSPHRASLMTGKYPFCLGMWTNCKPGLEEKVMLRPQEISIGKVLKENGYSTGYIGKWHLDAAELGFFKNPASGAAGWDAYTPPGERRQGFDYWLSYGTHDDHLHPHYWRDTNEQIKPEKWSVEYETDRALDFLEEHRGKEEPFALFVSYNPPHLPYELVPEKYESPLKSLDIHYRPNVPEDMRCDPLQTDTRQYFAAVNGIDEHFGRIMDYLREHHMEENTLVVLSADHGDMMGSQGLMSKNVWYEESIHIPLVMRWKGKIASGVNDSIFASVDHMPTLLGLLDLPVPETCQGYDHAPGILGSRTDGPEEMFICSYPGGAEMVAAFAKRGLTHKAYGWRGIKGKNFTYVISNGYEPDAPQEELYYNDGADPWQLSPRKIPADCKEKEILELRGRLKKYLDSIDDPFLWRERGEK